ncbi:hypothetical protein CesoFtcFv8_006627 [Champsocephalus esox]|uniref:Uncharacterized protein n=1 Tax=Champsocephalus esox TaxID=159716 RepID=A0AAN8CMR1_9TELE|nr:hypothetical protein CesoFtcFv8_006627 [Champsocephalus esox]
MCIVPGSLDRLLLGPDHWIDFSSVRSGRVPSAEHSLCFWTVLERCQAYRRHTHMTRPTLRVAVATASRHGGGVVLT